MPGYIEALKKEIVARAVDRRVATIYFGGGTPSLLTSGQITGLLGLLKSKFMLDSEAEVSLEANPGTLNAVLAKELRGAGINRLSIGAQSFHDDELRMLGRIHRAGDVESAFRTARDSGFANINLDLIYGLPGQSLSRWEETLRSAIELGPEHISCYLLSLEDNVPLKRSIIEGRLPSPDDDLVAGQYELAEGMLAEHGYEHYELSNWARPGYRCRHNLFYWQFGSYLGFGAAAHSFFDGHRLANTHDLDLYLENPLSIEEDCKVDKALEVAEATILGLRMFGGIDAEETSKKFGEVFTRYQPVFEEVKDLGLLEFYDGRIRLTGRGRLLSNEVFWRLLPGS